MINECLETVASISGYEKEICFNSIKIQNEVALEGATEILAQSAMREWKAKILHESLMDVLKPLNDCRKPG